MRTIKIKNITAQLICMSIVILLTESSLEKLSHFSVFRMQLKQSPWILISANSLLWAWTIPMAELILSGLMLQVKTRILGCLGATVLFTSFLLYMLWIWSLHKNLACGCNAFIEKLSIAQHVFVNIMLVILSVMGVFIHKTINSKKVIAIKGMDRSLISESLAELPNK
jgi:hypothetical protein